MQNTNEEGIRTRQRHDVTICEPIKKRSARQRSTNVVWRTFQLMLRIAAWCCRQLLERLCDLLFSML